MDRLILTVIYLSLDYSLALLTDYRTKRITLPLLVPQRFNFLELLFVLLVDPRHYLLELILRGVIGCCLG
jgi:hypothetical protein